VLASKVPRVGAISTTTKITRFCLRFVFYGRARLQDVLLGRPWPLATGDHMRLATFYNKLVNSSSFVCTAKIYIITRDSRSVST
jgi:hypothetical protein